MLNNYKMLYCYIYILYYVLYYSYLSIFFSLFVRFSNNPDDPGDNNVLNVCLSLSFLSSATLKYHLAHCAFLVANPKVTLVLRKPCAICTFGQAMQTSTCGCQSFPYLL